MGNVGMEEVKFFSQLLFLSGWSIIGIFLARQVLKMREDVHTISAALGVIAEKDKRAEKDLDATISNVRDLRDRVIRLERNG